MNLSQFKEILEFIGSTIPHNCFKYLYNLHQKFLLNPVEYREELIEFITVKIKDWIEPCTYYPPIYHKLVLKERVIVQNKGICLNNLWLYRLFNIFNIYINITPIPVSKIFMLLAQNWSSVSYYDQQFLIYIAEDILGGNNIPYITYNLLNWIDNNKYVVTGIKNIIK